MCRDFLELPSRTDKLRRFGVTMAIDKGLPFNHFVDVVTSGADYLDFVKFGWGTSVVMKDVAKRIDVLRSQGINFYFGGTLFEKYVLQGCYEDFRRMCHSYGCEYIEVSNGTIDLSDQRKSQYVAELSREFHVISEVGSKDQMKSENMAPNKWISSINDDLAAGAILVTLETRESGHSGICRPNGELRFGLVEEIVTSGLDVDRLLFEAPSNELQGYFVKRLGPNVNLGNVSSGDIINVETIRLGLRSETLFAFEDLNSRSLLADV